MQSVCFPSRIASYPAIRYENDYDTFVMSQLYHAAFAIATSFKAHLKQKQVWEPSQSYN